MAEASEDQRSKNRLKVLFLAAEADPLIKVGGLGDVSGSLPRALARLSGSNNEMELDILVAMPFHSGIKRDNLILGNPVPFVVKSTAGTIPGKAWPAEVGGVNFLLIAGPPVPAAGPVYSMDTQADGEKFTFAALGALEAVKVMGWQPTILHANDWHTAMAIYAALLRRDTDPFYRELRSILTIHNMPFIGVGTAPALEKFGLPPFKDAGLPWWAEQLPLPLGLASADRIVAVSPGYSQEILTPEYGNGLEGFLQTKREKISGILNGIDTESWNPKTDQAISVQYSHDSVDARSQNKASILKTLSLPENLDIPLMAFVGRMDPQKGVDLVIKSLPLVDGREWRAVILGTGDEKIEQEARELEQAYPDRVRAILRFDGVIARQLYAGSDILLMPSRYEPCGLAQMIAMRYGCIPLARNTGGLKDTIYPYPEHKCPTGFLFSDASPQALTAGIEETLDSYNNKNTWRMLQLNGMHQDFSWKCSALAYAKLYNHLWEEA
jgi:starch synthase